MNDSEQTHNSDPKGVLTVPKAFLKPSKKKVTRKSEITRPSQKYDLVEIWWDDASALDAGWTEKVEEPEPQMCISVGFLIKQTEKHVIIAMDLDPEGKHNGRSQIPVGMVKHTKILRKKDKKYDRVGSPHSHAAHPIAGTPDAGSV